MGLFYWIFFGLVVGILAKWIMPGTQGGGIIITIILGVVGSTVGGWISTLLDITVDSTFGSIVFAVIGALLVLFAYERITKKG